jgi:transporter family protein
MWLYLGVFSAAFLGLYDISRKHALRNNAVLPVLFFAVLVEAIVLLPIAILSPFWPELMTHTGLFIPNFDLTSHLLVILKTILVAVLFILAYFSMKHLPISIVSPIGASGPAWTLIGAMAIFGERLSMVQWAAFGILFISYYIFSVVGSKEGIVFHNNKWVTLLFIAVIAGAGSALYDKFLVQKLHLSAVGVQVWFMLYMVPLLAAVIFFFWWPKKEKYTPFEWRWSIPLIGIWLGIADVAYFKAIGCQGTLISLLAAVRSSGVLVSFLGGAIFFGENQIRHKAIALAGVLAGVFMLFLARSG